MSDFNADIANYKEFILKAVIPSDLEDGVYNVYLFNDDDKLLLHYATDLSGSSNIVQAKIISCSEPPLKPSIYTTFLHSIHVLSATLACVYIYACLSEVYYANIRFIQDGNVYDINCKLTDAICLALSANKRIYVSPQVCVSECIHITKELLEDSLRLKFN